MSNADSISARMPSPQGSAPKMPMRSDVERGSIALAPEFVENGEHVARRHHDDFGREVADQLHLLFRLAARHRDHRAPRRLRAVVRTESAREQPVAVGDVHRHAAPPARRPNRARDQIAPGGDVVARIADHRGFAGGAGGGVNARHLVPGHGEKAEGIGVAQVRLGGERKASQIRERAQLAGMHAGRVELAGIAGVVRIGVMQRRAQTFELQGLDLIAARAQNRLLGNQILNVA